MINFGKSFIKAFRVEETVIKRISIQKDSSRVNVILRHLIWENVDKVPSFYKMCILMLWMASARYYLHIKNKNNNIGGKL